METQLALWGLVFEVSYIRIIKATSPPHYPHIGITNIGVLPELLFNVIPCSSSQCYTFHRLLLKWIELIISFFQLSTHWEWSIVQYLKYEYIWSSMLSDSKKDYPMIHSTIWSISMATYVLSNISVNSKKSI